MRAIKGSVSVGYANLEPANQSPGSVNLHAAYHHGASVGMGFDPAGRDGQAPSINPADWNVQYQRGFAGGFTTEDDLELVEIDFIRDLEYR